MPQKQRKGNLKPVSSSSISDHTIITHPLLRTLLNKRDENTLVRALGELLQVQYSTIDYQEWTVVFNKLVNLPFKRCRSLAVKVQGMLTVEYGKIIYSFLPNSLTNWMRCLFDPCCNVEANDLFNTCFPKDGNNENRIWEFSQKRVLTDILDFILYETPESLCNFFYSNLKADLRFVDIIDANQTFERVTESNIFILIKLLSILDMEKRTRFVVQYQNIFKESKFWKLLVSEAAAVRRAMYQLVRVLCDFDHGSLKLIISRFFGVFSLSYWYCLDSKGFY